ncbi:MAG: FecCD family ABC transporter permease [Bacillota bacterium]
MTNRRSNSIFVFLILLAAAALAVGLYGGAVAIPLGDIARILWQTVRELSSESLGLVPEGIARSSQHKIIIDLRLPRVILAGLTGAALAASGATYQGLFQNPMADPYIIGVSSGAAVGAAVVMVFGSQWNLGGNLVPLAAFCGATMTVMMVYLIARTNGRAPVATLLLVGVAVSAALAGVVALLIFISGREMRAVVYWTMGGLDGASWSQIRNILPFFVIGMIPLLVYAKQLNAMLFGDETASYLGVDVAKLRLRSLLSASMLAAAAVSVAGTIGFVGLIVPHIVRLLVGPDHRILVPASALAGIPFLIAADLVARTVVSPAEMPVGIITAMLGGPFFLYLLRRERTVRP